MDNLPRGIYVDALGKFPDIKPQSTLKKIIESIYATYVPFIDALKSHPNSSLSSERSLVQEFVAQNDYQLRKLVDSIRVDKEYTDNFHGTKGIPDFAFFALEEGLSNEPIFIVEAKILPAPNNKKQREKEYVVGHNNNGGVERFKLGRHGLGLNHCGLLGFINNDETIDAWIDRINSWIIELSLDKPSRWYKEEILEKVENSNQILSIARRSSDDVCLHHFFVKLM